MPHSAENKELEGWAAWIVAAVLGGRPERRDLPGASATPDYDLILADGSRIALEVTTSTSRELRAQQAAIYQYSGEVSELRSDWGLTLPVARARSPGPRIARIRKVAHGLLAQLEAQEVERFDQRPSESVQEPAEVGRLRELRVSSPQHLGPAPQGRPARIYFGTLGPAGAQDGSDLNDAVILAATANAAKLAKADADQRHLFVWADGSDPVLQGFVLRNCPPRGSVSLPDKIDVVWVGVWSPRVIHHCYSGALWRLTPGGGWQALAPPDVLAYIVSLTIGRLTGDGSFLRTENEAFRRVSSDLIAHGANLRRSLGLPIV